MEKLIFLYPFHYPLRNIKILNWKKQFHGHPTSNQGQALVTWILMLFLILMITVSTGSAFSLIQDRMRVVNLCRIESLKIQAEAAELLKKLFELNPRARLLRYMMTAARLRLAAALAHYNVPMAARARYDISQIRQQQQALDQVQKMLISKANVKLHTGTLSTYVKLKEAFQVIKQRSSNFAQVDFFIQNPKIPKLAVKPEDYNLAPPYLMRNRFEEQQKISHGWIQSYKLKGFLKAIHQSQSQCHVTLEENTWIPKIKKDRPYSKWF